MLDSKHFLEAFKKLIPAPSHALRVYLVSAHGFYRDKSGKPDWS